jgi:hypothetical protein
MSLIGRFLPRVREDLEEVATAFIYVYLPEPIEADERFERYHQVIDSELRVLGIGYVGGGGTLLSEEQPDGSRYIIHSGVDVEAIDVPKVREILRALLPELGCRPGTCLRYRDGPVCLRDEFDGAEWSLARPQPEDCDDG